MKKIIFLLLTFTSFIFAGDYDREERILEREFNRNFPVLETGKNIRLKEIDVDIKRDGGVEVEVEFARGSQVNTADYHIYADKLSVVFKDKIQSSLGSNFYLREIELDSSGIRNDKQTFRY